MACWRASAVLALAAPRIFELALEEFSFPVALIRAGGFFENYMYGLKIAQAGTMPMFYAPTDRKVGHIATADIGALVVELLTTVWSGRRMIELGRPVSPDEIAEAIGDVLGRKVKAEVIPRDAWAETMEQFGLPKGSTWAYEEMMDGVNSGWIDFGVDGTEKLPGATTAKEVYAQAKA